MYYLLIPRTEQTWDPMTDSGPIHGLHLMQFIGHVATWKNLKKHEDSASSRWVQLT
jgi:hypothetical protein